MQDLLFISHRIPYPPDKGEKIRAWHILRHLALNYRVHLATFVDAAENLDHLKRLQTICASVFWRPLSPNVAKLRSLRCLLNEKPLTQGYFGDARFAAGIEALIRKHKPSLVYVFSSAVAPYVMKQQSARVIVDMVDVDSEKWRQYAETSTGLKRWIYAREGRCLLHLERHVAGHADAVLLVSQSEAEMFKRLAPEVASRTHSVSNGVDTDYFSPSHALTSPFGDRASIVFTGMMDYRPNIEAMKWFVRDVMPRIKPHSRNPGLWIVGANPSRSMRALAGPDVRVTGRVADVRPYLRHATAVVAPLRIGRGIQNKVLEAMAMGTSLVVTPEAREGLDKCQPDELLTADSSEGFLEALTRILDGGASHLGARARARVLRDYQWAATLSALDEVLETRKDIHATPTVPMEHVVLREPVT